MISSVCCASERSGWSLVLAPIDRIKPDCDDQSVGAAAIARARILQFSGDVHVRQMTGRVPSRNCAQIACLAPAGAAGRGANFCATIRARSGGAKRRRLQHRHIILIEAGRRQIYAAPQIRRRPPPPACSISAFTFCTARARRSRAHFRCAFCLLSEISRLWPPGCCFRHIAGSRDESRDRLRKEKSRAGNAPDRPPTFPKARRQSALRRQDGFDAAGKNGAHRRNRKLSTRCIASLRAGTAGSRALSVTSATGNCLRNSSRTISITSALSTVYQKLGNRYIDADVRRKRARTGVELFDRSEGFHKAIELLRCGGRYRHSRRSTRRRPRSLDAVFRPARLDFAAPGVARETNRCRGHRGGVYTDGRRAGGWFSPRASIRRRLDRNDHGESERDNRATNSRRAGRLVLGSQPLENAEAEFSPHALQARRLCSS